MLQHLSAFLKETLPTTIIYVSFLPLKLCEKLTIPCRLVIIAGDISPIDVITHVPILCEDANIPYIYVPSKEVSFCFTSLWCRIVDTCFPVGHQL